MKNMSKVETYKMGYEKQRVKDFIWLIKNIESTKKSIEMFPTSNMIILHRKLKSEMENWKKEAINYSK